MKQFSNTPAWGLVECPCLRCLREAGVTAWWMVVCEDCGNKRCPHMGDHRNDCTGSNEPGQVGSADGSR